MAVLGTTGGNLVIKDTVHAMDKDTRSLFAFDNRKNDKKNMKNTAIPELHLLSYYADITGPRELRLKNHCTKLIQSHLKNIQSDPKTTHKSLFDHCSIEIMHISHYSFEFIINITNNTLFLDEHKLDTDTSINRYLVGAYQKSAYDHHKDEFITIGVTSSIGDSLNNPLYNFYIDDFIQDLYIILCNHCAWYDSTCELPTALWQNIAQFTMDGILPVAYTRSDADEILLNNGQLHVFLDKYLREYHVHKKTDDSGDMKMNNNNNNTVIDDKLVYISQIFVEFGRIIDKQYHLNKTAIKLKSEYDKWKKQGFKKRANMKPLNMNHLVQSLQMHQNQRYLAQDIDTINELQCLYFINPNFSIKYNKNRAKIKSKSEKKLKKITTLKTLKKLFAFSNPININYSQTDEVTGNFVQLTPVTRSQTQPFVKKNKKNKKNKMYNNQSVPSKLKSKSNRKRKFIFTKKKKKKKKKKKNKYMTMDLLYNTMDDNDDGSEYDGKLGVTQSVDDAYRKNIKKTRKLIPTMNKPKKCKSDDVYIKNKRSHSPYSNSSHSPYSHDENVIMYVDMDYKQEEKYNINIHKKRESGIMIKVRDDIGKAYKEYKKEKGKIPNDIQAFVSYCKKKKNIKKANWTLCQSVIKQFQTNLNSVQE